MFGRRKKLQEVRREIEDEAVRQVMEMTNTMTFPGAVITPEAVANAAHMVSMDMTQSMLQAGAPLEHITEMAEGYKRVGAKLGSLFAPGGPYEGSTAPEIDER